MAVKLGFSDGFEKCRLDKNVRKKSGEKPQGMGFIKAMIKKQKKDEAEGISDDTEELDEKGNILSKDTKALRVIKEACEPFIIGITK